MKKILNEWRKFLINESPQEDSGQKKDLSKKDSYVENGKIKLYHFSSDDSIKTMSPVHFAKNIWSRKEYEVSSVPRSFFYTNLEIVEPRVKGTQPHLYTAEVDANKIYDFKKDPDDYWGTHRDSTYGMRKGLEWNSMMEAFRENYDGIYYTVNGIPMIAYFKNIEVEKIVNPFQSQTS